MFTYSSQDFSKNHFHSISVLGNKSKNASELSHWSVNRQKFKAIKQYWLLHLYTRQVV